MPSSMIKFRSRSWVIGLGGAIFSISRAIAFASYAPTQIGSIVSLSTSFKIMIGVPLLGSIISALIFTSISIINTSAPDPCNFPESIGQCAIKTIGLGLGNHYVHDLSGLGLPGPEVDDLMAS